MEEIGKEPSAYRVGSWQIHPDQNQITHGASVVRLKPKAMDVLLCLIKRAPNTVSIEELLADCWPGRVVGDAVVYKRVNELREAFSESVDTADDTDHGAVPVIATVSRRGYRINLPVVPITDSPEDSALASAPTFRGNSLLVASQDGKNRRWWIVAGALVVVLVALFLGFARAPVAEFNNMPTHAPVGTSRLTIAIPPFLDATNSGNLGYVTHGLALEVSNALQRVEGLEVVSPYVFLERGMPLYKVRADFGAGRLLDVSIKQVSPDWRLLVQMVDTNSGVIEFSEPYTVASADMVGLPDLIAGAIAAQLIPQVQESLAPVAYRPDPEAYRRLLRARELSHQRVRNATNTSEAIAELQLAIERDPEYSVAYAELARQHLHFAFRNGRTDFASLLAGEKAALRALNLDSQLSDVQLAAAEMYKLVHRDYRRAAEHYTQALTLNPTNADAFEAYAHAQAMLGNADEAVALIDQAFAINPHSALINRQRGRYYLYSGNYRKALRFLQRSLFLNPDDTATPTLMWIAYHQLDRPSAAVESLLLRKRPIERPFYRLATAIVGEPRMLEIIVDRDIDNSGQPCGTSADVNAQLLAFLGKEDEMFDCLAHSLARRDNFYRLNPLYAPFRLDARFAAMDQLSSEYGSRTSTGAK